MEPPTPSLGNLDLLPPELVFRFLLQVESLEDLAKWCQTSQKASEFCRDEGFWHQKYLKDFWEPTPLIEGETWRSRYRRISLARKINSPLSAGRSHYGIIDQSGKLYMAGRNFFRPQVGHPQAGPEVNTIGDIFKQYDGEIYHTIDNLSLLGKTRSQLNEIYGKDEKEADNPEKIKVIDRLISEGLFQFQAKF